MDCSRGRIAISARLDGEDPGEPPEVLDRHLGECPGCRWWEAEAAAVTRAARLSPAGVIHDLTAEVLARHGALRRGPSIVRVALAVVAAAQLVAALPGLTGEGGPVHLSRELASWSVALAVGLAVAAWRPARAAGMLPLVAALVGMILLTSGIDLADGRARAGSESSHLLEALGLALLWLLAHPHVASYRRQTTAA